MMKYGGNTTCFELITDEFQIFFDTGSGFQNAILNPNKEILVLFSHFHHDHLQGLAFNKYLLKPETKTFISSALVDSEELNKIIRRYFSGVFFPLESLPEYIQPFAEILPLSMVADAMRSIASDGLSLVDIYLNIIGIGVWIGIGTLISTKLFVWKEVAG